MNELQRGDRVEIVRGSWSELTGTITLLEYTETPDGQIVASGFAYVHISGEPADIRFPVRMLAKTGAMQATRPGAALL